MVFQGRNRFINGKNFSARANFSGPPKPIFQWQLFRARLLLGKVTAFG